MLRKLKFYFIGLVPGLLIIFFILNQKGAKCSGYLPESRVLAETLTKDFRYSEGFKTAMAEAGIDEKFLRDSILGRAGIDFDKSHAQKKPCPDYQGFWPKKNPRLEFTFQKCRETATFINLKKIN